ncbi:MAG: DUF6092 family protein [Chloroflexi bacterium]|nr:DUF6092 family protein [Chloroflexota bacterium]MCC6891490.1 hypothetical protein [Anaerolineae bacterium]
MSAKLVLTEEEALELLALLVTSARIQIDEPARYGPLRLLTAADRLSTFIKERASAEAQPMIAELTTTIPDMAMYMSDEERYVPTLDRLCRVVAQRLVEASQNEAAS